MALERPALNAVKKISDTSLSVLTACLGVLLLHILVGIIMTTTGLKKTRWE